MIKRTLDISQRAARLSLKLGQLVIRLPDEEEERSIPCEDLGVVILQNPAISITAAALNALLQAGAAVIICNEKHLPSGLLLPTATHTELVPRMMAHLSASLPARKNAWKLIVQGKIRAQASLLEQPYARRLHALAEDTRSGDANNHEAQAARIYWPSLFPEQYRSGDSRDPEGDSLFNALLNYGYAIIRASTARAIVSAGLVPSLGVFHSRRDNPFCLADDLMEPFRPLVDREVKDILRTTDSLPSEGLTQEHRRRLLTLLTATMSYRDTTGPLMAILPRYINGFHRLLTREADALAIPTLLP
jgi:CRISP-associated protein Cas1